MRVTVSFTVEIDTEEWTRNYGVVGSRAIRNDVRAYAENMVREQFREVGVLSE